MALASAGSSAASSTSSHIARRTEPPPSNLANVSASSRGVAPLARLWRPVAVTPESGGAAFRVTEPASPSASEPETSSTLMLSSVGRGWRFWRGFRLFGLGFIRCFLWRRLFGGVFLGYNFRHDGGLCGGLTGVLGLFEQQRDSLGQIGVTVDHGVIDAHQTGA